MSDRQQLLLELSTLKQRITEIEKVLVSDSTSNKQNDAPKDPVPAAPTPPSSVAMDATRIVMHQIVAPTEVDALGICFGGQVLSWIDICAGLSAKTLARGPCVTISVDAVHFFRPCRGGDVVIIAAMVNRTFSSSMEVGVRVEAENMRTGERRHCCSAYLTFVSLHSRGPAKTQQQQQQQEHQLLLPRVVPSHSEHARIFSQAEARRQQRLAARKAAKEDPERAAAAAASRLKPITHREGCPTLPPALTLQPDSIQYALTTTNSSSSSQAPQQSQQIANQQEIEQQQQQQQQDDGPFHTAAASSWSAAADVSGSVRRSVPPSATTAYMTQSIMPQHANTLGITFGGQVMSWMEQCAYISASRLRGTHLLTAGMDSVTFAASTRVGDIIYITAQVSAIFTSSLEVMISVFGEAPADGRVFHCADAFATLVVVDMQGEPMSIPFQLVPTTPAEKLRFQGAQQRRAERLAMRSTMAAVSSIRPSLDGTRPLNQPEADISKQRRSTSLEVLQEV